MNVFDSKLSGLEQPVNNASLAVFRIVFGLLMFAAAMRFFVYGWIDEFFLLPDYHFSYLPAVQAWPKFGMYIHFGLLALTALLVACGYFYRLAITCFFVLFTYVELIDRTTYLNHYYLISIVSLLMIFLPLADRWSLDNRRRGTTAIAAAPFGHLLLLRVQFGLVYFFAGVAKLNTDWLFEAQPLRIWLGANTDFPLIGPLLSEPAVAYAASWIAAGFDLTVVFFLCWKRTRWMAFLALSIFHIVTWKLFSLGIFPWVMILGASLFFAPAWPLALMRRNKVLVAPAVMPVRGAIPKPAMVCFALFLLFQSLFPLRSHLYAGSVLWHEQGFRFSWRVMLIEKTGLARFHVKDRSGRDWLVYPHAFLDARQVKMMSTQPDMILSFAHYIGDLYRDTKGIDVASVSVESFVSLNGRPSQRFIAPSANLLAVEDIQSIVLPLQEAKP